MSDIATLYKPVECWHGHRTPRVGCVSCVLVFNGKPAPDAACPSCTALRQQLAQAQQERDAIRELMNTYNLGGWTDAVEPMKRAEAAEARLREVTQELSERNMEARWQADPEGERRHLLLRAESAETSLLQVTQERDARLERAIEAVKDIDEFNVIELDRAKVIKALEALRDTPTEPTT